ncbi:MAG: hypothetical protein RLZZ502_1156 [Pseudomonadota bacterium]
MFDIPHTPIHPQRRQLVKTLGGIGLLPYLHSSSTQAQANTSAPPLSWPQKPVTLVVPFPAGGGTDAFARPLAAQFSKQSGKQLIIDNRGGAGGTLGAGIAARANADAHTLFMGAVHHTIAPFMYPKLDYDLERDFAPLLLVATVPQVLVVNPKRIDSTDVPQLLTLLKKYPGRHNFASAGSGTSHHLAGELFKILTKTAVEHVPYRGAGPALQDLIAGNVDMMFDGMGSSINHIRSGRIKALMVAGNKRNSALPEVPCAAELGLNDYQVSTWYGVWAPKACPTELVQRATEELRRACVAEEIKSVWANQGAEFPNLSGPAFESFIKAELRKWQQVVKTSGAKLD